MIKNLKSKKILCVIFAIISLFNICTPVCAASSAGDEIQPLYAVIDNTTSSISISGIKATCKASVTASYSTSLKITMELQKEKSSGYETVETWTKSGTGTYLSDNQSKTINIFSTYRLKTTFTAGGESVTLYSY